MTNRYQQRAARELAERHDTGSDARMRELRAENARRAAAALRATPEREGRDLTWLARDVFSTPYAEVRS